MKKYYILAIAFLSLLMGQSSYAQDYQPNFGGDEPSLLDTFTFDGINEMQEVVVTSHSGSSNLSSNTIYTSYSYLVSSLQSGYQLTNTIQSTIDYYAAFNQTPPVPTWYYDNDGDGYYGQSYQSESSPGYYWKGWTYGYDCNDNDDTKTTDCSTACTTSCPAGYLLNQSCGCEVVVPCGNGAIANSVYDTLNGMQTAQTTLPSNIRIIPPSELPTAVSSKINWTDPNSSFNSTLYRVDHGNGNIEFVYATEGTVSLEDWKNDFQQGLGYASEQYKMSVNNAVELANWANEQGFKLSFTGHSLGGGLANANALATGLPATIYNPAGLHDDTINNDTRLNLNNSKNVTAYVVRGEPVDIVNNYVAFTPVRGTTNYIGSGIGAVSQYVLADFFAGPLGTAYTAYDLHSMSTVLSNLDCN